MLFVTVAIHETSSNNTEEKHHVSSGAQCSHSRNIFSESPSARHPQWYLALVLSIMTQVHSCQKKNNLHFIYLKESFTGVPGFMLTSLA